MTDADQDIEKLLAQAQAGDMDSLAKLFDGHRQRLERMVVARMDPRLRARVSSSDVLQDVFVDVQRRFPSYNPEAAPFFIWLRGLAGQRLVDIHRFHLGAQQRSAGREVRAAKNAPDASSLSLAAFFIGQLTTASQAAIRSEIRERVQEALERMDPTDREILSLRHFEQLSNVEAARELDLNPSSASTRHLRALKKLRQIIETIPGLAEHTENLK